MTLTLNEVLNKSKSKILGLHEVVAKATTLLIENSFKRGVNIIITQGLRTIAEQNALYAQGRTTAGSIVTNAKGGYSNHNFGVAIDFALLMPNGTSVSWDTKFDYDKDSVADWTEVVEEAKKLGFEWGGDWKSFKDMPHFEMTFGLSTSQYRNGEKPSQTEINKILTKLENGKVDEEMTEQEKKAFVALEDKVKAQDATITTLTAQIEGLVKLSKMTMPTWANDAVATLKTRGAVDTADGGSYDFYRVMTILKRLNLI